MIKIYSIVLFHVDVVHCEIQKHVQVGLDICKKAMAVLLFQQKNVKNLNI